MTVMRPSLDLEYFARKVYTSHSQYISDWAICFSVFVGEAYPFNTPKLVRYMYSDPHSPSTGLFLRRAY
jgi:hypothetical protein